MAESGRRASGAYLMSALNKLAHLSLVNKVTTELENHIGIADKTLSEFIIDLRGSDEPRAFQRKLLEMPARSCRSTWCAASWPSSNA